MLSKHSTREEILSAFETNGTQAVMEAHPNLLNSKRFMSYAVKIDGLALAYAAPALKNDKKMVMVAIKQSDGWAFFYASNAIKGDLDIKELMREINPWISRYYFFLQNEYDNNHILVVDSIIRFIMRRGLSILSENPLSLESAPSFIKDNKGIVTALVEKNGLALKFASERLRNYFKVVRTAVVQNGNALDFASKYLQTDRRLLNLASKTGGARGFFYYGPKFFYYQFLIKDPAYETRYQMDLSVFDAVDSLSRKIQTRKTTLNKNLNEVNETIEKTNARQAEMNESLKQAANTIDETSTQNQILKETLERTDKKLEETEELLQEKESKLTQLTQDLRVTLLALEKKEAQLEQAVRALEESEARFNQQIKRLDEAQSTIATLLIEKENALKLAEQTQKANTELNEINLENNNLINQERASTEKLNKSLKALQEELSYAKEEARKSREHKRTLLDKIEGLESSRAMLLQHLQAPQNPTVFHDDAEHGSRNESSPRFFQ